MPTSHSLLHTLPTPLPTTSPYHTPHLSPHMSLRQHTTVYHQPPPPPPHDRNRPYNTYTGPDLIPAFNSYYPGRTATPTSFHPSTPVPFDPNQSPPESLCTVELNALLMTNAIITEVETNDPLGLLSMIKSIITTRCDGDVALEQDLALREWYPMTMLATEDIVTCATRAGRIFERLKTVGVPTVSLPSAPQHGRRFIDGPSDSTPAYVDYITNPTPYHQPTHPRLRNYNLPAAGGKETVRGTATFPYSPKKNTNSRGNSHPSIKIGLF